MNNNNFSFALVLVGLLSLFNNSCSKTETKCSYYKDGRIAFSREVKNGEIHGKCIEYYDSGEVKFESEIYNGKGFGKKYYKDGKLFSKGEYIVIKYKTKDGEDLREIGQHFYYYQNGKINALINYSKQPSHNIQMDGLYTIFYKNGNKYFHCLYKNGKMEGKAFFYTINEELAVESLFQNGKRIYSKEYINLPDTCNNVQFPDLDTYYSKINKQP
jgi:antitoxin component YwqK of YwqJK toxin-antitoxin module